jgi:hypothetical protein
MRDKICAEYLNGLVEKQQTKKEERKNKMCTVQAD